MKPRRTIVALLLLMVGASPVGAETIGLDEYLRVLRLDHPLFPAEQLAERIERARRDELAAVQDWAVEGRGAWSYTEPITSTPFAARWSEVIDLGSTVRRPIWSTGARLALQWQTAWTDQQLPTIEIPSPTGSRTIDTGPDRLFSAGLGVRFTQPLWRNRGGALDRLAYEAAAYEVDASSLQALEAQEAFLLEMALMFVEWTRWSMLHDVAADRVGVAREQLDLVQDMRSSNLVDRVDVLRAEDALAAAERGLSLARAQLRGQRAALATLAQMDDLGTREPSYALTDTTDLPDVEAAFAELRPRARTLRVIDERIDAVRLQREGAAETTDPELDLGLDLTLRGGDRDAYPSAWGLDSPDASVALTFRQALGAGRAEAAVDQAELRLLRLDHRHREVELELHAEVARHLALLAGLADALALHAQQVDLAARTAASERELYREGRNPLTFVLQAQDAEQAARSAWIETGVRYHQTLLRYRSITDDLLPDPLDDTGGEGR